MEVNISNLSVLLGSTALIGLYYTSLKKHPKQLLHLLLWTNLFSYIAFSTLFFLQHKIIYITSLKHIESFVYDFIYVNLPLYLLLGFITVGSLVVLEYLSKKFPISMIVAVSKVSIITSTIGYILLGNSVTTASLIGVFIVFIGAVVSGLPYFSFKNPLKPLSELSPALLSGAALNALCASTVSMITFICTAQKNDITRDILHEMTRHLHGMPFHSLSPMHFNIGAQFAVCSILFLFIKYYRKHTGYVLEFFKNNPLDVIKTSFLYIAANFCYYFAFELITDKTFITAIYKLYIPTTLLFGYLLLQEKPKLSQLIGAALIIFGAFFTVLF